MRLIVTEFKLFLRDPAAAFFTLMFPLVLLVTNGAGDSREPVEKLAGERPIDVAAPMLITLVIALLGFTTLPPTLAYYRESGILRRLGATPISPMRLLGAVFVVHLLITLIGLAELLVVGMTLFGLAAPRAPLHFGVALLAGSLAIFAIGFVVAALARTGRVAGGVGLVVFFPMLYLSGTMQPREMMSEPMGRIGDWTPLAPVVRTLRETWAGEPVHPGTLLVLAGITVVATATAARTFRW